MHPALETLYNAPEVLTLCNGDSATLHWRILHSSLQTLEFCIEYSDTALCFLDFAADILQCVLRTGEGGTSHQGRGRKQRDDGGMVGKRKWPALCRRRICHSAMETLPLRSGLCNSTAETLPLHRRLLQSARETLAFLAGDSGTLH